MKIKTQPDTDSLYELIRLVRPLYKTLEASVAQELEKTGVSVSQRAVLEQILDNGSMTVPTIGRKLVLPRQFIQKIANELLELGLIQRRENQAHKRSVLLELTAKGLKTIEQIKVREVEVMKPVAAALNQDELTTAKAVMTKITAGFDAHNSSLQEEETR